MSTIRLARRCKCGNTLYMDRSDTWVETVNLSCFLCYRGHLRHRVSKRKLETNAGFINNFKSVVCANCLRTLRMRLFEPMCL